MRRFARNLIVLGACVLSLAGGGADGQVNACTVTMARSIYGAQTDFGVFFAYIFNIPGRSGSLSSALGGWFEGNEVAVGNHSKKAGKLSFKTYKGTLQAAQAPELAFPTKPKKDKRATISATHDYGGGWVQTDRAGTGVFDVRLTVAIDDAKGLISGESHAYLQMNRPPAQYALDTTSIVATYMEDGKGAYSGMQLQAFEDFSDAIDEPQLFAGTAEVDLRIQQTDTQLITMARPTPPGGPATDGDGDGWITISSQNIPVPLTGFALEFGARNMLKKGTFFFDYFSLGNAVPGPPLELAMFEELAAALIDLGEARDALLEEAPGTDIAESELNNARDKLAAVQTDLDAATDGDDLDDSTEGKTAAKVLKRAIKGADRLIKTLEKGKTKKPEKLAKPVQRVIDDTVVIMANVAGLKTRTAKQLSFVPPSGS